MCMHICECVKAPTFYILLSYNLHFKSIWKPKGQKKSLNFTCLLLIKYSSLFLLENLTYEHHSIHSLQLKSIWHPMYTHVASPLNTIVNIQKDRLIWKNKADTRNRKAIWQTIFNTFVRKKKRLNRTNWNSSRTECNCIEKLLLNLKCYKCFMNA